MQSPSPFFLQFRCFSLLIMFLCIIRNFKTLNINSVTNSKWNFKLLGLYRILTNNFKFRGVYKDLIENLNFYMQIIIFLKVSVRGLMTRNSVLTEQLEKIYNLPNINWGTSRPGGTVV